MTTNAVNFCEQAPQANFTTSEEGDLCGICRDDLLPSASEDLKAGSISTGGKEKAVVVLNCSHIYHFECIETLIFERTINKHIAKCPLCSQEITEINGNNELLEGSSLEHKYIIPIKSGNIEQVKSFFEFVKSNEVIGMIESLKLAQGAYTALELEKDEIAEMIFKEFRDAGADIQPEPFTYVTRLAAKSGRLDVLSKLFNPPLSNISLQPYCELALRTAVEYDQKGALKFLLDQYKQIPLADRSFLVRWTKSTEATRLLMGDGVGIRQEDIDYGYETACMCKELHDKAKELEVLASLKIRALGLLLRRGIPASMAMAFFAVFYIARYFIDKAFIPSGHESLYEKTFHASFVALAILTLYEEYNYFSTIPKRENLTIPLD